MTIFIIKNIIIIIIMKMFIIMASASTKLKFKVVRANTRFNCCEGWKWYYEFSRLERLCPSILHRPNPTNLFPELTIEIDLTGEVENIMDLKTIAPKKRKKWLIQSQVEIEESVNRPLSTWTNIAETCSSLVKC